MANITTPFDLEHALPALPSLSSIGKTLGGILTAPNAKYDEMAQRAESTVLGFPIGRIVAVLLGLVLIAAGVFSFSRVQDTVKTVVKAAA